MSKQRGITLVETLVTMTIVVILFGITLSVLRQSIGRAKATVCLSNLKQIHLAMSLYREDHGDYPISNLKLPGLTSYFGGTPPKCGLVNTDKDPWQVDYLLHGSRWLLNLTNPEVLACMEARGPMFPIAHESNHSTTLAGYHTGRQFYMFVRADGSAGTVGSRKFQEDLLFNPSRFPCPSAPYWANL